MKQVRHTIWDSVRDTSDSIDVKVFSRIREEIDQFSFGLLYQVKYQILDIFEYRLLYYKTFR